MVGNAESFNIPCRGIIGVRRGEAPLVPATSGGTAGIIDGEETTVVESEWLFRDVSELERLRLIERLMSIWVGATPRCGPR